MPSIEQATQGFYAALNAMLGGDAGPMLDLWSHADDVTYMSPFGELLLGWDAIAASWQGQADAQLGGRVDQAEVQHFSADSLGFAVGFERGEVHVDGVATTRTPSADRRPVRAPRGGAPTGDRRRRVARSPQRALRARRPRA